MRDRLFRLFLILFGFAVTKKKGTQKGTLLILIDGLSFEAFSKAVSRRYCPTMKKLIKKQGYLLKEYYCGLPASTTATEALLFYGNKENIPGFTWYDRHLKEFVRGNRSYELSRFEDSYAKTRNLLSDGSSIMSVYAGGATQLNLSGRNLSFSRSLSMLKSAHYLLMALLYPMQVGRACFLTLKTLLFYNRSKSHTAKETMSKLFLGQFSCFLTEVEIMRNTQRIFVDFLLYDEFAHEYGPLHPTSLSTLRLVDRYVKRILHTAKNSGMEYEIVILSDHGQTASVPYDLQSLRSESEIRTALADTTRTVFKTYGGFKIDPSKKQLFLVPAGSTLQLYFSESLAGLPLIHEQIEIMYPGIVQKLLRYDGFGWILVREKDGKRTLYGKRGSISFSKTGTHTVIGEPFHGLTKDEASDTVKTFSEYSLFENNGDLVIFGSVRDGAVVSFERHRGTHGGFYGPMVRPFILCRLPLGKEQSMEKIFSKIEYNMKYEYDR